MPWRICKSLTSSTLFPLCFFSIIQYPELLLKKSFLWVPLSLTLPLFVCHSLLRNFLLGSWPACSPMIFCFLFHPHPRLTLTLWLQIHWQLLNIQQCKSNPMRKAQLIKCWLPCWYQDSVALINHPQDSTDYQSLLCVSDSPPCPLRTLVSLFL